MYRIRRGHLMADERELEMECNPESCLHTDKWCDFRQEVLQVRWSAKEWP